MADETRLLWLAVGAYVLAGTTAIGAAIFGRRWDRVVLLGLVAGLVVHAASIALRWQRLDHGPFVTMFEILSSNVWSLLAVFAVAYWRLVPVRPMAAIVLPVMYVMMAWLLATDDAGKTLPGTFHTLWLYVHIGFGKLFLGSVLVAVGIAGIVLLRGAGVHWAGLARAPDDGQLDELAYRFMAFGLVMDSLMLIAGAIWAQDAWGRYWSWDPLEVWALVTWVALAFAMHLRSTVRPSPRLAAGLIILVFALAFLTLFGVPFVSEAPHQGVL